MPTIGDAIELALQTHRGQRDKAGREYILHPLRVMHRLGLDAPEAAQMAAVLHDTVEDSGGKVTAQTLAAMGYSPEVVGAVLALTRNEGESYEEFIERAAAHPIARLVKRADLEDNMDVRRLGAVGEAEARRLEKYRAAWLRIVAPR